MALSGYTFRSLPIIQQLARDTRQSPPLISGQRLDYVDSSLTILAKSSVTKVEYEARQTLQEKAIRGEFQQQRTHTDGRFEEQRTYMDGRFEEQRTYMDGRFDQVDGKLEEQRTYMDGRFDEIDDRFEQVNENFEQVNRRFEGVDERFDRLEVRFDQFEGRWHNSLISSTWEEIHPIGVLCPLAEPGNRFRMPQYFPNKIIKFWRLKQPQQVKRLVYLHRFFNTQGYERWGTDDIDSDDSDSSDSSRTYPTLEAAVRAQPEIALRTLATHLGLRYDKIARSMEAAESAKQTQAMLLAKRRLRESEAPAKKIPRKFPPAPVPVLTLEELFPKSTPSKSPSEPSAVLGWENSFKWEPRTAAAQSNKDTVSDKASGIGLFSPRIMNRLSLPQLRRLEKDVETGEERVSAVPSEVSTEEIPESERLAWLQKQSAEGRVGSVQEPETGKD